MTSDANLCGAASAECLLVGASLGLLAGLLDVNVACMCRSMLIDHGMTNMVVDCLVECDMATRCAGVLCLTGGHVDYRQYTKTTTKPDVLMKH